MPHLKYMIAHYSSLQSLGEKLFEGSTSLEKVWLHNNAIQTIHADAFQGLGSNLEELYLGSNSIESLDPTVFSGLTALNELWMMENNLTSSSITCSHLCDLPTTVDLKVFDTELVLSCGSGCAAGDGVASIYDDASNVCGYSGCVAWDLNSGWRAGWGTGKVAGVMGLACGVLLLVFDLV